MSCADHVMKCSLKLCLMCKMQNRMLCLTKVNFFFNKLPLFYLKMQAKKLLTANTVQTIIEEFQGVHNSSMKYVLSKVHDNLTMLNVQ